MKLMTGKIVKQGSPFRLPSFFIVIVFLYLLIILTSLPRRLAGSSMKRQ